MWTQVRFRNFKSLKDLVLDLSNISIFTGGNAAGKSSVIQGILLAKSTSENGNNDSIKLNGPYNLALGRAEDVICATANSHLNEFSITVSDPNVDYIYWYQVDPFNKPYTVELNNASSSGNIGLFNEYKIHYLSAERIGPRKGQMFDPEEKLMTGYQGEYVNHVLERADQLFLRVPEKMKNPNAIERFSTQVEAWMQLVIPDFKLQVTPIKEVDMVTIMYGNTQGADLRTPTSTGFGISYSLPVVTAGLLATVTDKSILIVENPEAHLHPYSQSRLGQFLALVSLAGVQVIVETHSEHVINGIRIQLTKNNATDTGIVHYMKQEDEETKSIKISITKNGELSNWPKGFFDQEKNDLFELLKLKRSGHS